MKNVMVILATLVLGLFLATAVRAENWQFVAENSRGARELIDQDSIRLSDSAKRISATIQLAGSAASQAQVWIDHDACINSHNGKMTIYYEQNKKYEEYFWDSIGDRTYDATGKWLCEWTIQVEEYLREDLLKKGN